MKDLKFYLIFITFGGLVLLSASLYNENSTLIEINESRGDQIDELRKHLATLGNCYSKEYRQAP